METKLQGKYILVTGASGGIGLAISHLLYEEHCNIVMHYNTNYKPIEDFILNHNYFNDTRILAFQADLRNEKDVELMFSKIKENIDNLDGLVNNAGIWPSEEKITTEMSIDQFDNTIDSNLRSYFLCSREFINLLKDKSSKFGSIIFIGSTAGIFGEAGHIDYSISKAALNGMMLSMKNEICLVAKYGRVNIVSPGWVKTPMAEQGLSDLTNVTKILQTTALRKVARPEDIANIVVFLMSDFLASHITGQNIVVAGGMEGRVLYQPNQIDLNNF